MGLPDRVFATLYDPLFSSVRRWVRPHREYLAADLNGRILDVGTGTGRQISYLAASTDAEIVGIDPDPYMLANARERTAGINHDIELTRGVAESLPYARHSFDAVISSMTLCTVDDPQLAVGEIKRVLKPDGELRVLEHVKASPPVDTVQRAVDPCWQWLARGCHLSRETEQLLTQTSGLVNQDLQWLRAPVPFFRARYVRRD